MWFSLGTPSKNESRLDFEPLGLDFERAVPPDTRAKPNSNIVLGPRGLMGATPLTATDDVVLGPRRLTGCAAFLAELS